MRIEPIRAVKARLNEFVSELPTGGSVIITKNGRPCAVLMPITDDTDLEAVALAQNKKFWTLYDRAFERGEREGWTRLDQVDRRSRP
ncbi:MAG TPA: type II toxin-antitoxin system prevent-host-death family antitoxin [Acidobacteriota bacterium]